MADDNQPDANPERRLLVSALGWLALCALGWAGAVTLILTSS